jgi:hypothetical protein
MVKLLKPTIPQELAMLSFLQRFSSLVTGVLSGFDRLRFRGSKCLLNTTGGMLNFLWHKHILLKDFKSYVTDTTDRLRRSVERAASDSGRPVIFLNHQERKEDLALKIAARDGIRSGLICVESAVECCRSFSVHPDRKSQHLVLKGGPKKCLHYYHYYLQPHLGLMHARLQSTRPTDRVIDREVIFGGVARTSGVLPCPRPRIAQSEPAPPAAKSGSNACNASLTQPSPSSPSVSLKASPLTLSTTANTNSL